MSESKTYRVISPIDVGGVITKTGTVELDEKTAARFLAMKDCPIADQDSSPGKDKDEMKSGSTDGAGSGGDETVGLTEAQIVEAIGKLDPDNNNHWTKGNKPELKALESILGSAPSAAERDAAWSAYQAAKTVS